MNTQIQEVVFTSNEYSETPSHFQITLSKEDIDKIKICQEFIEKNKGVSSVSLYADAIGLDYDEDTKEYIESDWRTGAQYYIVYSDAVCFYAQNKWDSGDQIECEVNIEEIL